MRGACAVDAAKPAPNGGLGSSMSIDIRERDKATDAYGDEHGVTVKLELIACDSSSSSQRR